METVLALTLVFHCSSRRGVCADWGPGICSIASTPRANMLVIAIPIRSGRIEISLGTRRLCLYRGKARLICRQIIGLPSWLCCWSTASRNKLWLWGVVPAGGFFSFFLCLFFVLFG